MALLTIPTFQDGQGHIYYTIQWEGSVYYVYLDRNARDLYWYLSIHDATNTPIEGCVSRKVVVNWDMLKNATIEDRPPGQVWTYSIEHEDPTLLTLGEAIGFYYLESSDLDA